MDCFKAATNGLTGNETSFAKAERSPLPTICSELLADKDPSSFWRFLDAWTAVPATSHQDLTDSQCAQQILAHASQNATKSSASLFHLSLSLRLASPKLVVYRQLATESLERLEVVAGSATGATRDDERWLVSKNPPALGGEKCCWVETPGRRILQTAQEVELALSSDAEAIAEGLRQYDFDHVHPASKRGGRVFVLYGALGTPCFRELHAVLTRALQEGKSVTYIYR